MNTEQTNINAYIKEQGIMRILERYANSTDLNLEDDAKRIHEVHRSVQSNIFSLFKYIILELASKYEEGIFDSRNKHVCQQAYIIREKCYEKIGGYWFIKKEV